MSAKLKHKLSSYWREALIISMFVIAIVTVVHSYQNKYRMGLLRDELDMI